MNSTTRGFAETSPTHDTAPDSYDLAGSTTATANNSTSTATATTITTPAAAAATTSVAARPTLPEIDETGSNKVPSSRSSSYDNGIDYDALYEEEEEMDLSMEAHGSMITHLLSQVKIGMDLTKVVLPTFILERRSLLEMYADYFAHPDLFLK